LSAARQPGPPDDAGGEENAGRFILLIGCRSRFAVLERRLFVGGHALFGHRQDHGDADIGSGDRRQIDDLLFAEKFLGASRSSRRPGAAGR
jgi:hypothetical protein